MFGAIIAGINGMNTEKRTCPTCGRSIAGRLDKKFCDDSCRNTYNNKHYGHRNNYIRRVNGILNKNRRLLESTLKAGEEIAKLPREKLGGSGYNFQYHTHQYMNKNGQVYYFCYEYGYLSLENDWLLIVKRKEQ